MPRTHTDNSANRRPAAQDGAGAGEPRPGQRRPSLHVSVRVPLPATATVVAVMGEEGGAEGLGARHVAGRIFAVATDPAHRAVASFRDNVIASVTACLIGLGLFLDGWNHINLQDDKLGAFLTPWHYGLYAGFSVAALWVLTRNQARRTWRVAAVPRGYGLGIVALVLAPIAVGGDAIWHTAFGLETGITRVISPFHLILLSSGFLLATCGFRASWAAPTPARVERLRTFAPVLLSLAVATCLAAFFAQFVSPFETWIPDSVLHASVTTRFDEAFLIHGVLGILVTNAVLMAPVLLILRRWEPPFGTMAVLLGVVAAATGAETEFSRGALAAAAVAAGIVGDIVIARLRPTPTRLGAVRAVAFIIPAVLWASVFIAMRLAYGITWVPELWGGALVLAALTGVVMSILVVPSPVPAAAWPVPAAAWSLPATESTPTPTPAPAQTAPEPEPVDVTIRHWLESGAAADARAHRVGLGPDRAARPAPRPGVAPAPPVDAPPAWTPRRSPVTAYRPSPVLGTAPAEPTRTAGPTRTAEPTRAAGPAAPAPFPIASPDSEPVLIPGSEVVTVASRFVPAPVPTPTPAAVPAAAPAPSGIPLTAPRPVPVGSVARASMNLGLALAATIAAGGTQLLGRRATTTRRSGGRRSGW